MMAFAILIDLYTWIAIYKKSWRKFGVGKDYENYIAH